jgi:hypothetical protein
VARGELGFQLDGPGQIIDRLPVVTCPSVSFAAVEVGPPGSRVELDGCAEVGDGPAVVARSSVDRSSLEVGLAGAGVKLDGSGGVSNGLAVITWFAVSVRRRRTG